MATAEPDPIDISVGARIRERRRSRGMSQSDLARALGITFQQVQKYERGSNRISASKLARTSQVLEAPISYFFEQAQGEEEQLKGELQQEVRDISRLMTRLRPNQRRALLRLVEVMGDPQAAEPATTEH